MSGRTSRSIAEARTQAFWATMYAIIIAALSFGAWAWSVM